MGKAAVTLGSFGKPKRVIGRKSNFAIPFERPNSMPIISPQRAYTRQSRGKSWKIRTFLHKQSDCFVAMKREYIDAREIQDHAEHYGDDGRSKMQANLGEA